ncbi:MAG TPA: hypothetical protein VJR58_11165 [Vineibacter sp.]|nr:hypothetical protein [Vineibacter sp.]
MPRVARRASQKSGDDKYAELLGRTQLSASELERRWVESGLERDAWLDLELARITDLEAAIAEADAGKFASDEEVEAMFARWRR